MKSMLIDLQIDLFRRGLARKYSPDQPRDDRGRWTSDGGGEGMTDISAARRTRVAQNELGDIT